MINVDEMSREEPRERWAAFEAEAMPYADQLFRLAMWFERDRREAEDLVQDTMVQALGRFIASRPAPTAGPGS